MRTTIELLDAVKMKLGVESDYKIAQILGITKSGVSKYRNGKSFFDDDIAILIADILEVEPLLVLATVHAERARSEQSKKAWVGIIDKLGGTAAGVALAVMLTALSPIQPTSSAAEQVQHNNAPNIHYTKRRRRNRGILSNMVEQLMARPRLA